MKVLLLEDVYKLGWLGDIVEVKGGYARNYLLPQGLATVPSEENIAAIAEAKAAKMQERKLLHEQLSELRDKIDGATVTIEANANVQGHLFGSVSAPEIGEALRKLDFAVTDDMVSGSHIKQIGTHQVSVRLATDLLATVNVAVVAEGQEVDQAKEK